MSSVDLKELPINCLLLLQLKGTCFKESLSVLGNLGVMVMVLPTVSILLGAIGGDYQHM